MLLSPIPARKGLAALRAPVDRFFTGLAFGKLSLPSYMVAILLIYLFAVELNWLPATGMGSSGSDTFNYFDWNDFKFAVMPIIALSLPPLAIMTRTTRSSPRSRCFT